MSKALGILIGGIFVGAVGAEILRRKCPGILDKLYEKTREVASQAKEATSQAKEAFRKGYENAKRSGKAAEPIA